MTSSLSDRDLAIVRLANRLRHVTSAHIHELVFSPHSASRTPCDRALNRLVRDGYLDRTEKRQLGGTRGGSGYYVYRLGRRGHYAFSTDAYKAARQGVEHSLAVADVVVILRQLEQQGLQVEAVHTEPDCHVQVGGVDLKPDLFVEFQHPRLGHFTRWIEADMGTQGRKRIMQKCGMYAKASKLASAEDRERWTPWPRTLFIAVDEERRHELNYLLRDVPEEYKPLFAVTTREELPRLLS